MRYLKVVGQGAEDNAVAGKKYTAGFMEAGKPEAVYESRLDGFRVQKLKVSDSVDPGLVAKLDQFMSSRATSDLVRMFNRSFRGDATGQVMELIAEGQTETAGATAVKFRFYDPDGELIRELLLTPQTEAEKKRTEALTIDIYGPSIDIRGKNKRVRQKADRPAMTQDTFFMNELCKAFLATGW